ncbi:MULTISPECIES: putative quinol monooxygenase [Exiguobacterium]|uniref:putative quinol monooxygenase n=1 Tax=Exiguobacterium TaxID=33986 RepID=UPI001BEA5298|nr:MULTISPECIES: putative quinol monooxygenase [Exiguobacterium]MCT4777912.1 antibiotic biosynthesis monooxygenase [Exiguobacterium aquaticum]MCT4790070.1 antibiotic biosynthesis monooxygenase [Exiguobacterium mexicanum]
MIIILAQIQAKPGLGSALETHLRQVVAPSRAEAGCVLYTLHRVEGNPDAFVFYEQWADKAALDAHIASAHYQTYREQAASLLASRDVQYLEEIKEVE